MAIAAPLTVLCGLIALIWISRNITITRERRKGFSLGADYVGRSGDQPMISVIVAAKDEEANIETCIRTMLQQDYPNFELIVCNDRSTDRTAEIVQRLAEKDSRLKLVNIEYLPEGWGGKNNAMQTGIELASGEWICMIDADCRQTSSHTLRAAINYAIDTQADLLSILPTLEMKGFWENVVQPVCGGMMMIWFQPEKVNSPKYRNAYANGAFMLITRQAYNRIGKHENVKHCVNEDIHMAGLIKAGGMNLRVVRNKDLYVVRMYTSLQQIYRGWSRIFFGTFVTLRRIVITLAVLLMSSILPYVAAATAFTVNAIVDQPSRWWLACGVVASAAVLAQMVSIFRFYRLIGARSELAWSYVIGSVIAAASLLSAISKLRKGAKIVWRSTSYASTSQSAK